ncbi:hypothetical protein DES53_10183 [Roseimicrobium gellanilyticum]|uniref:Uncharacterized protein n=1 Tax=Roseimicrobium gellanilyticum TaxID=748857 RepID=A0A366HSN2_9BACT|nr:hypothetical protein DES53_10183 [Roseimicrobium gellanilyticum]
MSVMHSAEREAILKSPLQCLLRGVPSTGASPMLLLPAI